MHISRSHVAYIFWLPLLPSTKRSMKIIKITEIRVHRIVHEECFRSTKTVLLVFFNAFDTHRRNRNISRFSKLLYDTRKEGLGLHAVYNEVAVEKVTENGKASGDAKCEIKGIKRPTEKKNETKKHKKEKNRNGEVGRGRWRWWRRFRSPPVFIVCSYLKIILSSIF